MRGMWHPTGPIANFGNGQILIGSGNLAGRTFHTVKQGYNAGMWLIETSNTVEVN
jgi:hypothetical protein